MIYCEIFKSVGLLQERSLVLTKSYVIEYLTFLITTGFSDKNSWYLIL
ncbi:hypothetical protein LEP1GSC009_0947 [Leptospira interrogans serovar Grippotyphosa str. Andaman]|nr:hypothetical protein LEP1GSC009_0947 [Leptospira interrogans serovar Grippotyphosa str. Andaman]